MFLKKISIFGFKSFGKKEELIFSPGINAIVGPNGCGKSNILEAIRWVLGEQRINLLRGKNMTEVIFNGCKGYHPLSVAEVSIYLSNESKFFPIDFEEIVVTRRIYRSGENEYLINNNRCRLKDLQELFAGTGLGKNTFFIIEQGRIETFINSQPKERRLIFEEIAGISKYKMRKQEALRRLENTDFNLLRIEDLIAEIQSQVNLLEKEVKKTNLFNKLTKEIEDLRIKREKLNYFKLSTQYKDVYEDFTNIEKKREEIEEKLKKLKRNQEEVNLKIKNIKEEILKLSNKINLYKEEEVCRRDQLIRGEERKRAINSQINYIEGDVKKLNINLEKLKKYLEEGNENLHKLSKKIEGIKEELLIKEKNLYHIEEKIGSLEKILSLKKEELIDLQREIAKINNEIINKEILYKNSEFQLKKLFEEEEKVNQVLLQIRKEEQKSKIKLIENRKKVESIKKIIGLDEEELREKIAQKEELEASLNSYREELNRNEIKYATLKKLQDDFIGYYKGVKLILEETRRRRNPFGEVCEVVTDLIKVSPEFELVIEVALGRHIQSIVVEKAEDANRAISFLKKNKGQATFLVLELLKESKYCEDLEKILTEEGVIGKAKDLILFEPLYQKVFDYLLGNVIVVKNLRVGENIIKRYDLNLKLVSLSGEIINSYGVITGGRREGKEFRFLSRRRNLEKAKFNIREINDKIAKIERERSKIVNYLESIQKRISEKKKEFAKLEKSLRSHEENLKQFQIKKKDCEAIIRLCQNDKNRINNENLFLNKSLNSLKEIKREREELNEEKKKEINTLNCNLQHLQDKAKIALREVTNIKVALAKLGERRKSYLDNLERSSLEFDILFKKKLDLEEERKRLTLEIKEIEINKDKILKQTEEIVSKREVISKRLNNLQSEYTKMEEENLQIQKSMEMRQIEKEEVIKIIYEKRIKKENLEKELENIQDYLSSMGVKEIYIEDLSFMDEDLKIYDEKIYKLKIKRDNLREVNMNAPKQYQELKNRLDFMKAEKDDLLKAKEDLEKMIEKIDQKCKSLFLDTFISIKTNFSQIFKRLFEGGFGEILLTEEDPLSTGVDIIVQPQGKKFSNISLLSGGEKSLVAIALLFAILMVKPVPFCVLDEIDAALDDANTIRYVKILSEFGQRMQFLIITHNKKAIEIADTLYGITMQEPGISKVVSVNLKEAIS